MYGYTKDLALKPGTTLNVHDSVIHIAVYMGEAIGFVKWDFTCIWNIYLFQLLIAYAVIGMFPMLFQSEIAYLTFLERSL